MKKETVTYESGGLLCPLLATLFIGLKLTGQIDWSWWWVLAPIWIPFAVVLAVLIFAIIFLGVAHILDK